MSSNYTLKCIANALLVYVFTFPLFFVVTYGLYYGYFMDISYIAYILISPLRLVLLGILAFFMRKSHKNTGITKFSYTLLLGFMAAVVVLYNFEIFQNAILSLSQIPSISAQISKNMLVRAIFNDLYSSDFLLGVSILPVFVLYKKDKMYSDDSDELDELAQRNKKSKKDKDELDYL